MELQDWIGQYGYLAVFFGVMLEGESILLAAIYAIHHHYLLMWPVIGCAMLGAMVIDHVYFWIGRRHGATWLQRHHTLAQKSIKIRYYLERHQIILMLSLRFLVGLRTVTPILLGVAKISTWRFLCCNLISAALWASVMVLLGQWLAHVLHDWWHVIRPYESLWLGAVILCGLLIALWYRMKSRKISQ